MQPIPEPTPAGAAPPVLGESLVEFVRADRQRTAFILLAVSALLLAVGGWTAYTATKAAPAAEKKEESPFQIEDETKAKTVNRTDYIAGALLAGLGVLVTIASGAWLLVHLPPPNIAQQKTEARAVILASLGLLGAVIIIGGGAYFYLWSGSLFDWLDKGQTKQARYVIGPLLAVAFGALMMFLAIQPARAEERDNHILRRLIYLTNVGLSVLLVFAALLIVNLIVGPRLPNKLDVTASNFYSLSDRSKEFLAAMPEPVKAYAILGKGEREADDIIRLLEICQDASGGKFTVKVISPVSDKTEYRTLAGKYPTLESNEIGVLLTVGEDEKRHSFIRDSEFVQQEQGQMRGERGPRLFVGESRLLRELLFLAESEKKAIVYFTQSAGELKIDEGGEEVHPSASGRALKEYLTRNYLDVRPLVFDAKDPKVPDDAAVVIIAQPQAPLQDAHVAALRKYMMEPRGTRNGKLIVLAGPTFGGKNEVLRTGLEGLLREFNVVIDNTYIISDETREFDPITTIALFAQSARDVRNPIAQALGEKTAFLGLLWRQVGAMRQGGNPAYRAVSLLLTMPGRRSWLEDRLPNRSELNRWVADVLTKPEVAQAKQLRDSPRPVGAAVSDGEKSENGRLIVIGNGTFVSDSFARQASGEPPGFELIGGSVDWLRDRPPVNIGIASKKYEEFKFPATTDENRGLILPLLLSATIIGGLGIGVWMLRRAAA